MPPLLHHKSPECEKCPFHRHGESNVPPEGGRLSWFLYQRLSSRACKEFGLQSELLSALNLRLTDREVLELIDGLDAIADGIADAKPKGK